MTSTNLPAAPVSQSTSVDRPKRISPLGVNYEKAKGGLPGNPDREYRMGLDHERSLISAVRKAVGEALMAGAKAPISAESLLAGKRGDWIRKCQSHLYTELARQGIDNTYTVFLPLLDEASTPAKEPLWKLVESCHTAVPGAKPLKVKPYWCGNDSQ